jgi:hypothetical protein
LTDLDQPRQIDFGRRRPDRIAEVDIDSDRQTRPAERGDEPNAHSGISVVLADHMGADLVRIEHQPIADVDHGQFANSFEHLVDVVRQARCLQVDVLGGSSEAERRQ